MFPENANSSNHMHDHDNNENSNNQWDVRNDCPSETTEAGRAKVCEGCPGKQLCQQQQNVEGDPYKQSLLLRMNAIKHKIIVISGKGGVGKSSVAALLALALHDNGKKVGLLDVDICGPSIPKMMNLEGQKIVNSPQGWVPIQYPLLCSIHQQIPNPGKNGPHSGNMTWHTTHKAVVVMSVGFMLETPNTPVVWRGPRKTAVIKRFLADTFWGRLDTLIVDTPPGTSDEHLSVVTELSRVGVDGCVIVTTTQEVSLDMIRKEISFCRKMKIRILGIIENMSGFVCPCCGELSDIWGACGAAQKIAKEYSIPFLGRIPLDPNLGSDAESGSCLFCSLPHSPGANAMRDIIAKLYLELSISKK